LQHLTIYLQPFPRYSEILVENCNFFYTRLAFNAPVRGGPWDNRGNVTWIEREFNASQKPRSVYPSIFNRFPVIQAEILNVRHFSTLFAHFGIPWVRPGPGTIAVNVTWIEREFNTCQTPRSMYPCIYLQPFPSNSSRKFKSSPF